MGDIRLIGENLPDMLPVRRSGDESRHISTIIRWMCINLGHFKDDDALSNQTRLELGLAFEDAIAQALADRWARAFPDRFIRPGEFTADGLIGSPDLIDTVDWAIDEIKLTWISANHEPESPKFWRYWAQVKAYCYLTGMHTGRLHVCHINGDYRGIGPIYRIWETRFTEQELSDNWRMLVTNWEKMRG